MNNKSLKVAISIALILILTVGAAQVIKLANGDPIPWASTPNIEKPTLAVESPQNYTTYASSVLLNFTVTKPASWNAVHIVVPYVGEIHSVKVYLDGNQEQYGINNSTLNQLASGLHMLNVSVLAGTYYRGPIYGNSSINSGITDVDTINGVSVQNTIYEYPIVVSGIVYFTVGQPTQNTSPIPAAPEFPSLMIPLLLIIIVMAVGLLVYFKKHKYYD